MSAHQLSLANFDLSNTEPLWHSPYKCTLGDCRACACCDLAARCCFKRQPQCSLSPAPSCHVPERPKREWGSAGAPSPGLLMFVTQWAHGCWLWCVGDSGAEAGRANLASSLLEGFKQNMNIFQWPDAASSDICENSTQCQGLCRGGISAAF